MKKLSLVVSSLLAGICVGLGGLAFLSVENRVTGAALFTVGLFCICTFGFHLFTGKVCWNRTTAIPLRSACSTR